MPEPNKNDAALQNCLHLKESREYTSVGVVLRFLNDSHKNIRTVLELNYFKQILRSFSYGMSMLTSLKLHPNN
jgi:hypothetical protein